MRWCLLLVCCCLTLRADQPAKSPESLPYRIIDAAGKEQKIKSLEFTAGTRPLHWLAPPPPKDAKSAPPGPAALLVRDEMKFNFLAGVVTLIPLDRLRSIDFDTEKATLTVRAAGGPTMEDEQSLSGTTAYKGINKLTIEAEVSKGEAGVASVVYQGGTPKGIRGVRFPATKIEPFKPGRPAVVVTTDKGIRRVHKVSDLQPLYAIEGGREQLSTTLHFRKTLKLDVTNLKSLAVTEEDGDDTIWQVVQKDGDDSTLTLIPSITLDGKKATLVGFVGRIPIGYKLFPVRRIQRVNFDSTEEPTEPKKDE